MEIVQDANKTDGNYRCETMHVVIRPNRTENFDFVWPFDMNVSSLHFVTNAQHVGDVFTTIVAPNTIVGITLAPVSPGDTTIYVSPTVFTYVNKGYTMMLTDGTNYTDLGYLLSVDPTSMTMSVQHGSTTSFNPYSTYVMFGVKNVYNFVIGEPAKYDIGATQIGSAHVPANTTVRMQYTNKSITDTKEFTWYFEYFY